MAEQNLVNNKNYINDFRGLELLRFLLSCSVIVWHYQHFFYPFVSYEHRELFLEKQPLFNSLSFFYTEGLFAVHTFWFISGVIFYKIYEARIQQGTVDFKSFLINRFSRLYPLHLLTLFIVLVLQLFYHKENNVYFIYQENTIKTFLQNILFVQSWGLNKFSFNGPTWSVSIEILVYLMFFILAKQNFLNSFKSLILCFLFFLILKKWELVFMTQDVITSFYFFFAGCLFIKLYELYKTNVPMVIGAFAVLLSFFLFILHTPKTQYVLYDQVSGRLDLDILIFTSILTLIFLFGFRFKFFDRIPNKVFQFFGDMTYSTYLVHFPIQLIIYLILKPTNYTQFFSVPFFIIYMTSVFVIGRLVYQYFELPVQRQLRTKFSNSNSSKQTQ